LLLGVNYSRETLNKSFDELRTNAKLLIPFVVSLSNHEWNKLILFSVSLETAVEQVRRLTDLPQ